MTSDLKCPPIGLKFCMEGSIWLLFEPTKFQQNRQQKNCQQMNPSLLWLLKPQMNVPLLIPYSFKVN